jgi:hypothetical protein
MVQLKKRFSNRQDLLKHFHLQIDLRTPDTPITQIFMSTVRYARKRQTYNCKCALGIVWYQQTNFQIHDLLLSLLLDGSAAKTQL